MRIEQTVMSNQPVLETEKLSKDFSALRAVHEVDLKVQPGEIHSIIGPNGAGKTTFFNLLTDFLLPTSGRIFYKGKEITGLPPDLVIGLLFIFCVLTFRKGVIGELKEKFTSKRF